MFCTNCGARVSDDAIFCEKCGTGIAGLNIKTDEFDKQDNNIVVESGDESRYDQIYAQAELGVRKSVKEYISDVLFSKVTKTRVVRVTGEQLAMIFKKYFVDMCGDIDELASLKAVLKTNIMGKKIRKDTVVSYNKGGNRWIKDCEKKIIWELKTSLFDKEYFPYVNNVKQILEKKECEIQGIPYDKESFEPIKVKGKIQLLILTVLVWGLAVWSFLTDGGERSISFDDQSSSHVQTESIGSDIGQDDNPNSDVDISINEKVTPKDQDDLQEKISSIAENDSSNVDSESELENNSILEQHDYIFESSDAQMEIVLSYTQSEMGTCEFYVNYYDENGNVVNDEYYGTFAEGREGEGMLDLDIDGVTESIPYYYDYDEDIDIVYLVLVVEGKEIYFEGL